MGFYLPGADIHDFLACLGKHAVEKVSFGFSDLRTVEPECSNIVFVEDTDEFTHCADGVGLANKEEKGAAPGGWGESMQKEDNPGWGAELNGEAKNDAMPSDTGWAMAKTHPLDGGGWGNEQVAVQDTCWDSVEQDKAVPVSEEGGWGGKHEAASNNRWDSFCDVDTKAPAAQMDTWDSMEGQNPKNGISKGGFMHPSRRSMNTADSTEDPGASERRSGNFAPSGTNTVPLGRRKRFVKADVNNGLTNDEQCEEKDHMGWGASAPSSAGDDVGWGGSNEEEEKTHVNATQPGSRQDNWASGMDWETSQPTRLNSKNDSPGKDAWQTVPESEMPGMNGWGNDNDWNCKGTSEIYATAPSNPPDSWDAMEGQNSRKGGKRLTDINEKAEKRTADERRNGKFAPSGSNTIPLGKRKTTMKLNGSNNEPESMMMKSAHLSGVKESKTGWADCEPKPTAAEDLGWNNNNQDEQKMCGKSFEEELGKDGWEFPSKCEKVSAGQTNQGIENDSVEKGEGSADLHGWGSKVKILENVQDDGWGDTESDSPSVLCGNNRPKQSPSGWDSAGFKSFDTQPSRSVEQDAIPRPRKRFNRDTPSDSWTGFGSRSPQPQSRRPRLRSLLNSPEFAELDELYKAANKILHHNEYQLGDKLNSEDETFILEKILVHHGDKEAKVGCGVDYVMIDSHTEHQVSCFWVVRKDGSKTDFSYWKCLEGLYETKYSQGVTSDGVKNKSNDDWNWGVNSKASAKNDQDGAKGSWHIGDSSGAPTKGTRDKDNTKGSWNMGVSSAGPPKSMFDKEETKGSWDTGASSEVPVGESKDHWDMGASSAVLTKNLCKQGGGWDTWAGSAAPMCDQEEAQDSWGMGANSAANICDQATRRDVSQEEAKDGWGVL